LIFRRISISFRRLPQAFAGFHRLPQASAGSRRLPQASAGFHRLPQASGVFANFLRKSAEASADFHTKFAKSPEACGSLRKPTEILDTK